MACENFHFGTWTVPSLSILQIQLEIQYYNFLFQIVKYRGTNVEPKAPSSKQLCPTRFPFFTAGFHGPNRRMWKTNFITSLVFQGGLGCGLNKSLGSTPVASLCISNPTIFAVTHLHDDKNRPISSFAWLNFPLLSTFHPCLDSYALQSTVYTVFSFSVPQNFQILANWNWGCFWCSIASH